MSGGFFENDARVAGGVLDITGGEIEREIFLGAPGGTLSFSGATARVITFAIGSDGVISGGTLTGRVLNSRLTAASAIDAEMTIRGGVFNGNIETGGSGSATIVGGSFGGGQLLALNNSSISIRGRGFNFPIGD